jgi:hypothetical protein
LPTLRRLTMGGTAGAASLTAALGVGVPLPPFAQRMVGRGQGWGANRNQ